MEKNGGGEVWVKVFNATFNILYYCNLLKEFCLYFSSFGLYVQKLFVQEVITPILVT
jgi:hypothetical protein